MHCSVSIQELKKSLTQSSGIPQKNSSVPILSTIQLEASKDTLTIRATNLEVGLEIKISADVLKKGVVAVPAQVIQKIINTNQSDGNVVLQSDGKELVVDIGKSHMRLKTFPHDDFPLIPKAVGITSYTLPINPILEGLRSVSYASSVSDLRPEIASVSLYGSSDNLIFVATDSFRLAEKKIKFEGAEDFPHILIPIKHVREIEHVFQNEVNECVITVADHQISFTTENIYLTARIIDGNFPDYSQIIPDSYQTEIVALKNEFQEALKVTQIFSDELNKLKIYVKPKEKVFLLENKNNDIGEHQTEVDCSLSGEDQEITMNQKYLSEGVQHIPTDSLSISFNGNKPVVMRGVGDLSFLYIIMPMNMD